MISVDPNRDLAVIHALERTSEVAKSSMPSTRLLTEGAGTLRMLLIEGQLAKCAASHGIRLEIPCTDNSFIQKVRPLSSVAFFMSGGCWLNSVKVFPFVVGPSHGAIPPFTSDATRRMMISKFLDDPVLCVRGRLITRQNVISYVANKLGGIHYDARRHNEVEQIIDRARSAVTFRLDGDNIVNEVNFDHLNETMTPLEFLPSRLDCALIQIFATCVMLHASPDIGALQITLRDSIAGAQTKPG